MSPRRNSENEHGLAVFKLQRKLSEVSPELKFTPICMESKKEFNKCLEFPGFLCEIKDQHCKLDGSKVKKLYIYALYKSKIILDCPNNFCRVPIVLDRSNLFWTDPNHFSQVKIIFNIYIWTCTKQVWTLTQFGPKSFWTYRRTRH